MKDIMTEKVCDYCRENPGKKHNNKYLWNGFLDKDTNQLVCSNCRRIHYQAKSKTEHKGLYAEFPVYVID